MPLNHVLLYQDKYLLDCWHADAAAVDDNKPAMAARIAMSDEFGRTKVAFLAVSAIKQKEIRVPEEVLSSMRSSCGTCWKRISLSRE